jgi:hypothetical protein
MTIESAPTRPARHTWALVALITGLVLSPVAFAAHQVTVLATDTDRVASALEPLIDTPEVQGALVAGLADPLEEFFTSDALVQKIVDSAGLGITVPPVLDQALTDLLQPLIDQTLQELRQAFAEVFSSESFARSWRQIVADTHQQLGQTLQGPTSTEAGSTALVMSLQPFLVDVRDYLVDEGFDFLEGLTLPDVGIQVASAETMDGLIGNYRIVDALDPWLIALTLLLLGVGIILAPRRSTAWLVAGGGVGLGMVVSIVALWGVRTVWVPGQFERSPELAVLVADALLAYPITQAITIGVVATVVGVVGWAIESRISRQKAMT